MNKYQRLNNMLLLPFKIGTIHSEGNNTTHQGQNDAKVKGVIH